MMQLLTLIVTAALAVQLSPAMTRLIEAVRPVLPYPASTPAGDLPSDNNSSSRWFIVWPSEKDETRIIVRANPLHPEVQEMSAAAMEQINAAVAAAERRARESYDRALERLRKSGKGGELETITLDDEGVAGERIDAELEATIDLAAPESFTIASAQAPEVQPGSHGAAWMVSVPPHVYRATAGDDRREHFRAAETHVYIGVTSRPTVVREGEEPRYRVSVDVPAGGSGASVVVIRGNASLVSALASGADWSKLVSR